MSLRYTSRMVVQSGARVVQVIREHGSRQMKDTAASSSSSNRVRRLSTALDSSSSSSSSLAAADRDKRKRSEESLRTVMFLSCWGPN